MDESDPQARPKRLSLTTGTGQDDTENKDSDPLRGGNLFQKALPSSTAPGSGRVLRFKSNASQLSSLSCPVMSDLQHAKEKSMAALSPNSLVENDSELSSNSRENTDTGRNTPSSFLQTCTNTMTVDIISEDPTMLLETESLAYEHRHRSNLHMNPIFERLDNSSHTTRLASLIIPDFMDNSSRRSFATDESSGSGYQPPPSYDTVCRKKIQQEQLVDNFSTVTNESTQPPTYHEAVGIQRFLEDAPPTYQTLFAQSVLRIIDFNSEGTDANADERGMSFFGYLLTYLIFSAMVFVTAGMILFLPLAMISIGVKHLRSCPAQPRIPVFLTSLGVFQLLECCGRFSMYVYTKLRTQSQRERARYKSKDPFIYFIVVWFVVGSMWVYQNYPTCHFIVPGETDDGHKSLEGNRIEQVGRGSITQTTITTAKNLPPYPPLHVGRRADMKIRELIGVKHENRKATRGALLSSKFSQNTNTNHSQNTKPASSAKYLQNTEKNYSQPTRLATSFKDAKHSQNTKRNYSQSIKQSFTNAELSQDSKANYSQNTRPATSYAWTSIGSLMPTTREPLYKQKAACCGKTVYFFTFWIVTIYYSVIGLLFMVHICGTFVRLISRCRRDDHY